jgi:hypothetical protein
MQYKICKNTLLVTGCFLSLVASKAAEYTIYVRVSLVTFSLTETEEQSRSAFVWSGQIEQNFVCVWST